MKTKVFNFVGGPGAGKSSVAFVVTVLLGLRGRVAEYTAEVAKDLVWAEKFDELDNQFSVSKAQYERFKARVGRVEFIVTDGSLIHGIYYNRVNEENVSNVEKTEQFIVQRYNEFDNIVVFVERGDFPYQTEGRYQSEEEAKAIDGKLKDLLHEFKIPYVVWKLDDIWLDTKRLLDQLLANQ